MHGLRGCYTVVLLETYATAAAKRMLIGTVASEAKQLFPVGRHMCVYLSACMHVLCMDYDLMALLLAPL